MIYLDESREFTIEDLNKYFLSKNKNKNMKSTFEQLKELNKLRFPKFGKYKDIKECDPIYLTNAISGEAGELSNKVKHLEDRKPVTSIEIADEVGDILTYLDLFCQRMHFDLEECLIRKFNKVSDRENCPELKIKYNMDSEISLKYKRLTDELHLLRNKNEVLISENEQLSKIDSEISSKCKILTDELNSLRIENDHLKTENKELNYEITQLKNSSITLGFDFNTNSYCSKKELEESNFKLKKAVIEIDLYRVVNENLKKEIDFLSAKNKSIDVEKQQLRNDIEYYQKNYVFLSDHNNVISELNNRIKELVSQKESLSKTISNINESKSSKELEKLKEEIKKLNDNIHQKEFTVSFLKQTIKRHEETISKIKNALSIGENPFTNLVTAHNPFKSWLY